jgi:hypothetical protein
MTELPQQLRETLEEANDETLRATIEYAQAQLDEEPAETDDQSPGEPAEPPDEFDGDIDEWAAAIDDCDAPSRATLTTKQINGNQYLYWQWSENGSTKSEYIAPKNPT